MLNGSFCVQIWVDHILQSVWDLYWSAWVATIKYNKLDGLNNRKVIFSQFWRLKSLRIESPMPAWLVFGEDSFLACRQLPFLCPHMMEKRMRVSSLVSVLIRTLISSGEVPHTSSNPNYFLKALFPKLIKIEIKVST